MRALRPPTRGKGVLGAGIRGQRAGPHEVAERSRRPLRRLPACSDVTGQRTSPSIRRARAHIPSRRAVPYHVPPSGSGGPGTGPEQVIRWHGLAETSLNQHRQAPFCPSKCPSGFSTSSIKSVRCSHSAIHIRAYLSKLALKCKNIGYRPRSRDHQTRRRTLATRRAEAKRLMQNPTSLTHLRRSGTWRGGVLHNAPSLRLGCSPHIVISQATRAARVIA